MRPGELWAEMVLEPLLGCMPPTLRTDGDGHRHDGRGGGPHSLGTRKAVYVPLWHCWMALMTWRWAAGVGVALQVFRRKGSEESAEGGHDRSLPS